MIMAKVWGPVIVVSLGLGGACADTLKFEARNNRHPNSMEREFRINLDLLKYGFSRECQLPLTGYMSNGKSHVDLKDRIVATARMFIKSLKSL
jgi:hypothetical protein